MARALRQSDEPAAFAQAMKGLLKTPAAKARLHRKYPTEGIYVLPGLQSLDSRYIKFLVDLSEQCQADFAGSSVNGLAGKDGCVGGFDRLRTVAGIAGRPSGYVIHDNSKILRDSRGYVDNTFRDEYDEILFEELCDLMFSSAIYRDVKVASKSSSGFPEVTYDKEQKLAKCLRLLTPKNMDVMFSAFERDDGQALIDMALPVVYVQNLRLSPDSFGKKRYVGDWDFATRGSGQEMEINYAIDGHPDVQANRPRHVMGLTQALNAIIATWRGGVARYYQTAYAYTWHHTGREDLRDKLKFHMAQCRAAGVKGTIAAADVNQFDRSVRAFMLKKFVAYGTDRFFSERFGRMLEATLFGSVFQPDTGDGYGPSLHGDPASLSGVEEAGLLSGNDLVSLLGKLLNVWNVLTILKEVLGKDQVVNHVHEFLKGTHASNFRLLNQGDDCLLCSPNHALEDAFFEKAAQAYFKIEREQQCTFLGLVVCEGEDDKDVYVCNNIASFCRNTFVPERGIDSKLRPYWWIGLATRYIEYSNNPSFDRLLATVEKIWGKHLSTFGSFSVYVQRILDQHGSAVPLNLTWAEIEFLHKPQVVAYKTSEDDIRADLLAAEFATIPRDYYMRALRGDLLSIDVDPKDITHDTYWTSTAHS